MAFKNISEILNQLFILEVTKGHLKWKVSELARVTRVSRPLIYYHLGKTKKEILSTSIGILTTKFYGLDGALKPERLDGPEAFADSLVEAQKFVSSVPALPIFYLKCRAGNSELRSQLLVIEKQFQKKISSYYPELSATEIISVHSILHGIVCAPVATEETVRSSVKWLNQLHHLNRSKN